LNIYPLGTPEDGSHVRTGWALICGEPVMRVFVMGTPPASVPCMLKFTLPDAFGRGEPLT
jgi:hypothetical protein